MHDADTSAEYHTLELAVNPLASEHTTYGAHENEQRMEQDNTHRLKKKNRNYNCVDLDTLHSLHIIVRGTLAFAASAAQRRRDRQRRFHTLQLPAAEHSAGVPFATHSSAAQREHTCRHSK